MDPSLSQVEIEAPTTLSSIAERRGSYREASSSSNTITINEPEAFLD